MLEVTAELPMLALILTRKLRPIAIGSISGWLMLAGMIARPRATSSRTNSGVMIFGMRAPIGLPAQALLARGVAQVLGHPFAPAVLAQRDELHLGRDDAAARVVHLRDVGARSRAARRALQRGGVGAQRGDALGVAVVWVAPSSSARRSAAFVALGVAALVDPGAAHVGQAAAHVDVGGRVGVGARGVVERDRARRW